MTWLFPLAVADLTTRDTLTSQQGRFGYKRSYYYHKGVDLYTREGASVRAVEEGCVIRVISFTGAPESPHWLHTDAILIAGTSGVVVYGEIVPNSYLSEGMRVSKGDIIATVTPVLPPEKLRRDISGHSCSMLHMELHSEVPDYVNNELRWMHGMPRPTTLLNPTPLLTAAWEAALAEPAEYSDIKRSREYFAIAKRYAGKRAERSKLPYMNHIDEGLVLLQDMGASDATLRAWCLHPILQIDESLWRECPQFHVLTDSVEVMALAMEYRHIANGYLRPHGPRDPRDIKLSVIPAVNDMLRADKIQNYRDARKYHAGDACLVAYFEAWFIRLGVSKAEW